MKKPTCPKSPIKPTEPQEYNDTYFDISDIVEDVILSELYEKILNKAEHLYEVKNPIDPSLIKIKIKHDDCYYDISYSADAILPVLNKSYKAQMIKYEKDLHAYDLKYITYEEKKRIYDAELEAWNKERKPKVDKATKERKELEKEIKELQKKLKSLNASK